MVMAIVICVILLFLGIGAFLLIHVCIVGMSFRREYGNYVEGGSFGSTSTAKDDLEKLPCFDFKAREEGTSPVDCAVCLENFEVGDKCRLLPLCKHSFHAQCVDSWLLKTPICPICRTGTGAGSWKGGSVSGEESSSHFSGSGIGLRESQTPDSDHLSEIAVELSGAGVEPIENQTTLVEADHQLSFECNSFT